MLLPLPHTLRLRCLPLLLRFVVAAAAAAAAAISGATTTTNAPSTTTTPTTTSTTTNDDDNDDDDYDNDNPQDAVVASQPMPGKKLADITFRSLRATVYLLSRVGRTVSIYGGT